LRFPERFLLG